MHLLFILLKAFIWRCYYSISRALYCTNDILAVFYSEKIWNFSKFWHFRRCQIFLVCLKHVNKEKDYLDPKDLETLIEACFYILICQIDW